MGLPTWASSPSGRVWVISLFPTHTHPPPLSASLTETHICDWGATKVTQSSCYESLWSLVFYDYGCTYNVRDQHCGFLEYSHCPKIICYYLVISPFLQAPWQPMVLLQSLSVHLFLSFLCRDLNTDLKETNYFLSSLQLSIDTQRYLQLPTCLPYYPLRYPILHIFIELNWTHWEVLVLH